MISNYKSGKVRTPRNPDTLHNFGPASTRDSIVHTAERPGGDPQEDNACITMEQVQEWIDFMKAQDIHRVLVLLEDAKLAIYEAPGLLEKYKSAGFHVYRNPMDVEGSASRAKQILQDAFHANKKIVVHCTHGQGRCGRVAAGWVSMQYGLSSQEAIQEVLTTARAYGVGRVGDIVALDNWLEIEQFSSTTAKACRPTETKRSEDIMV